MDGQVIAAGFAASLATGIATGVGALPLFFIRRLSDKLEDVLLGFAAGVMLAASFFSLIIPGIEAAEAAGSKTGAVLIVIAALTLGAAVMWLIHDYAPHEHAALGLDGPHQARLRRIWLFIIAITLHNVPEGLAVGVGFGSGDVANGIKVATGIGLQNMPEGLAVAASVLGLGYAKWKAVLIALGSGMVEPVAGLIGATAVTIAEPLLPWGLGFAAGAMLFIVNHEIIPETHRKGHQNQATVGVLAGLIVMMFLDVTLG